MTNTFTLREYQEKAREDTLDALTTVQRVICSLPTGAGKTVIGKAIMDKYLSQNPEAKIRILVHRRELKKQWGEDLDVQTIQKVSRKNYESDIAFTSRDLLIVDEAHHCIHNTWAEYVKNWTGKVIGLTATPYRADPTVSLRDLWHKLVIGATNQELIEQGYLLPAKLIEPPFAYRIEGAGEDSFGDYSASATMELYRTSDLQRQAMVDESVKWLVDVAPKSKTIVFCMNTFHADIVRKYINLNTDRAAVCITAKTPMNIREAIFMGFEQGLFDTLLTVAVLTEGIDLPIADTALILRPTLSLSLYLQMIGRVKRPLFNGVVPVCTTPCIPVAHTCYGQKMYGRVLDATNNFNEFGHPDDEFVWMLDQREKSFKTKWICPKCEGINASGVRECEHCGYTSTKKRLGVRKKRKACKKCGSWLNTKTRVCDKCSDLVIKAPSIKDKPPMFINRNLVWTKFTKDNNDGYSCTVPRLDVTLIATEDAETKKWKGIIQPSKDSLLWEVGGYIDNTGNVKFFKYEYKSPLRLLNALTNATQELLTEYEYVVDVFSKEEEAFKEVVEETIEEDTQPSSNFQDINHTDLYNEIDS